MLIERIFIGITGAAVGSFLNVVIDRVPAGQSLLRPPSQCPDCGLRLKPWDLLPVVSYLALRGKCRKCGSRIPARVLLVEALTAGIFVAAAARFGFTVELVPMLVLLAAMIALFFTDLDHQLLPNLVTYPVAVLLLLMAPWSPYLGDGSTLARFAQALMGGGIAAGLLLLVYVVSRGGIGIGDIKLALVMGIALGPPLVLAAMLVGVVAGGLFASTLLILRRAKRKDLMPMGTFLTAATVLAAFWGEGMWRWYANLITP